MINYYKLAASCLGSPQSRRYLLRQPVKGLKVFTVLNRKVIKKRVGSDYFAHLPATEISDALGMSLADVEKARQLRQKKKNTVPVNVEYGTEYGAYIAKIQAGDIAFSAPKEILFSILISSL